MEKSSIADRAKENKTKNSVPLVTESNERYNKRSTGRSVRANQKDSVQKQMEALAQEVATRTANELLRKLNLDNRTENSCGLSDSKGENDMPKRLREKITVNGRPVWVTGSTMQQLFDNYVQALVNEGQLEWVGNCTDAPLMKDYIRKFFNTFKQKQVETTIINRERIIKNHILPRFGNKKIDKITSTDCQDWFNDLNKKYARETILKIKNTINPVFDAAVEERLIDRNPLQSKFIEIGGRDTVSHQVLPQGKMIQIRLEAPTLNKKEKLMVGLLSLYGNAL